MLLLLACVRPDPAVVTAAEPPWDVCAEQVEPVPPVTEGGAVYEVYVRAFRDSDADGVGDLEGVREKLPYLADLGVGTVWLMPLLPSPSLAGYEPTAYTGIQPDYGSEEALAALVADAEALGLRVIADLPINATSREAPAFLAAEADATSPHRDGYLFAEAQYDDLRWHAAADGSWYYGFFSEDLPDLDWLDATRANTRLGDFSTWLDDGLHGFRLDAVLQLVETEDAIADTEETHCLLAWLYAQLKAPHPDAVLLSESFHSDVTLNLGYLGTEERPEADWALDVPRRNAWFQAWDEADPSRIAQVVELQAEAGVLERMAPYLGSHDDPRLPSQLVDAAVRRATMVGHLLLPGHPILYYGEELDLENNLGAGPDFPWRGPMPWNDGLHGGFTEADTPWFTVDERYLDGVNAEAMLADPESLTNVVRSALQLRNASAAASRGSVSFLDTGSTQVLAFVRAEGDEEVAVILNFGSEAPSRASVALEGTWADLTAGGELVEGPIDASALPGYGYRVLATEGLAGFGVPGPVE